MILSVLQSINDINEKFFTPIDELIEKLPFDEWVLDAIVDSIHLLPFLFFIFIIIEILEFYFSGKITNSIKKSGKISILISSFASIFPQCGFSVMASSLYSRKIISRGCLIAVYLGTSDECLPILLSNPAKIYLVIPVICIKFFAAITVGYLVDFISKYFKNTKNSIENLETEKCNIETGCCCHNPESKNKRELFIHPALHTINIFAFILTITLALNYLFEHLSLADILVKRVHSIFVCVFSAFLGLIPNCAVSIALTMMLIKGQISLGAAMSGLLSNSGLGLLVLLKNNDLKDNLKIICILLVSGICFGIAIDFVNI